MFFTVMDSPVGKLLLVSDGTDLTGLYIGRPAEPGWKRQDELPVFAQVRRWLEDYFGGSPGEIGSLPLLTEGTPFQREIWKLLLTIPYGKTCTYGDIAREMARITGKKKMSAQAVGQAVGNNPISIIIPCHRVVGAKGKLTGYAWGIEKKEWLLRHEGSLYREEI